MIIKKEKSKKNKISSINKFLLIYFFSSLLIGSILLIFIVTSWTFKKAKANFLDHFSKAGRFEYIYLPKILTEAIKSNFYEINDLILDINFDNVLIIENFRNKANKNSDLGPTDLIPRLKTNINFGGKKYRGDLRLKGDRRVHFQEKKTSSYKIELDKNQYILGMKKFSIQKPRIRNYIHEWIFHEIAKDFNIIKLKYEFINLIINGENLGLYVIEEGFGKELIERNKRRNGPIFSIDEDISSSTLNPVFQTYNKRFWSKPENDKILRIAAQKLHDFFDNKQNYLSSFDLDKWAAYFAVVDFTSTYHGAFLKSVKFYYNPINGLFEPIPFDGHRLKPNYNRYNLNYDDRILFDIINDPINNSETSLGWIKKFFFENENLNQDFYKLYIKHLNKVSSDKYLKEFLTKNLKKINQINSHIYSDYFFYDNSRSYGPGLYYFSIKDFEYHAANIKEKIKTKYNIQVLQSRKDQFLIKRHYSQRGELFLNKFLCSDNNSTLEIIINKRLNNFLDTSVVLPDLKNKKNICKKAVFKDPKINDFFEVKIDYLNSKFNYKNFIKTNKDLYKKYFNLEKNKLFIKKNNINIGENLFIPGGMKVMLKPNQKIILSNNAFIFSKSPWIFNGKKGKIFFGGIKKIWVEVY